MTAPATKRVGKQLMTKTKTQEGATEVDHPTSDRLLFLKQPRVLFFVPHVHRPTHYPHRVEPFEGWDWLALIKLYGSPVDAVTREEVPELGRMLTFDVLQNQ